MARSARSVSLLALVSALVAALAVPAAADTYAVRDGRDIRNPGALDILSARVGHKSGKLMHALVLERSVTPRGLERIGGFIVFALSTDKDTGIERRVYVIGGGRFRVFVTNGSGRDILGRGTPYHPNARTLGAVFSEQVLNADGYNWYSAAVTDGPGDCCVDFAHNRYFFIHDFTAPEIDPLLFGDGPSTAVAGRMPAVSVPVTWHATDTGFGGLAHWTLRGRLEGVTDWDDMASGEFGTRNRRFAVTRRTRTTPWAQGVNVEVCLSLDDWGENRTTSWLHHFSVPYDDANTAAPNGVFEYSGPDWTHVSEGHPDDFLGTRSSTTADGASVTIRVPAGLQHYLVAPAGATATVDVTVNDQPADPITLNTTTDRSLVEITGGTWSADTSPDEIVLTRTGGGELRIDGYLGAPTYVGGTPYGNCGGRPSASVTSARASFASPRVVQMRAAAFRPEVARFRP